ncbi:NUDIX hydrolase [Halorarius litoreus]|uniref:NUDIX hydrolase n=1 Tax=Halorarius litoreus TaxID=2962676 RepID=UPI0020CE58D5|nr:NUDIX domain-containing protein [Halorarius litoreus]
METTRHFVATVYPVCDGATLLHEHDRLGMWLPPGGHIDRDELPHEAALRECHEETGLEVDLVAPHGTIESDAARSIPEPQHFLLEDINVHESGQVGHQHVDFVFYGQADTREVDPAGDDEAHPEVWEWFTAEELDARAGELPTDVVEVGKRAIETVSK